MTETHRPGCLEANMLAEYIDGGLEPRERAEVETHLAECGECYEVFSEAVRTPAQPAAGSAPSSTNKRTWWAVAGAAAAAAAVLIVLRPDVRWQHQRVQSAIDQLVGAPAPERISAGRLAESDVWAPASATTRGTAESPSSAMQTRLSAANALENLTVTLKSPLGRRGFGLSLLGSGRLDDAIRSFKEANATDQQTWESSVDLASALIERARQSDRTIALRLQDGLDAERAARRGLELKPGALPALFNLALALEASGQGNLAEEAWRKYLEADQNSQWSLEARSHFDAFQQIIQQQTPEMINAVKTDPATMSAVFANANCTGTIVGPRVILTAAHCVSPLVPQDIVFVYQAKVYKAECEANSPYNQQTKIGYNNTTQDGDWALCRVVATDINPDNDLDPPYATIAHDMTAMSSKKVVTLAGFGISSLTGSRAGLFMKGNAKVSSEAIASRDRVETDGAMIADADSGGPTYRGTAGSRYLVAVNSGYSPPSTSFLSGLHRQSAKDFIASWLARAANTGLDICGVTAPTTGCQK